MMVGGQSLGSTMSQDPVGREQIVVRFSRATNFTKSFSLVL